MSGDNLAVKVTADVADLQRQFALARAETNALNGQLNQLAKDAQKGILDDAGEQRMQQVASDLVAAKLAAQQLGAELKTVTAESSGFGESLEGLRGALSAAFEVTGLGVMIEGIKKASEAIMEMGERATQINSMSMVLGVTTDQFQALQAAAEESGVGTDVLFRGIEKLNQLLFEAHNNSGPAIASLRGLGLTADQAGDPTFKLTQLVAVLNGRLNDSSKALETQNELAKIFGTRGALLVSAFKDLDLSEEAVAETKAKLNGLGKDELYQLQQTNVALQEAGKWWDNLKSRMLLAITAHNALEGEDDIGAVAGQGLGGGSASPTVQAKKSEQAEIVAVTKETASQLTLATIQAEREQVEATESGTSQRMALARKFYEDSRQFYGKNDVAEVQSAYRQMLDASREYTRGVEELTQEGQRMATEALQRQVQTHEAMNRMLEADDRALAEAYIADAKRALDEQIGALEMARDRTQAAARDKQITAQRELEVNRQILQQELADIRANYAERIAAAQAAGMNTDQLATEETAAVQANLKKQQALYDDYNRQVSAQWKALQTSMSNTMASAVEGMLEHGKTLRQTMMSIFESMFNGLIKMGAEWVAKQIAQHLMGLASAKASAEAQVAMNAGVAGSGAMASVASIPE